MKVANECHKELNKVEYEISPGHSWTLSSPGLTKDFGAVEDHVQEWPGRSWTPMSRKVQDRTSNKRYGKLQN